MPRSGYGYGNGNGFDLNQPETHDRIFRDDGSAVAGRSSGFFVGTMKEFLATEWPAEHGEPVGVRE